MALPEFPKIRPAIGATTAPFGYCTSFAGAMFGGHDTSM
jgi:hypothetical protein